MRLVVSHCHLQSDRFAADVDLVIGAARLAGVERILIPGWDVPSSRAALELADRHRWLDVGVGIHPHAAAAADDAAWGSIVDLAQDPRVDAIGETGLDFDRRLSPIAAQLANLRRHLRLSLETGRPAILHVRSPGGSRDAQDALVSELRAAGFGASAAASTFDDRPSAIIHSFSGPVDYAQAVLDLGLAISISGLAFRSGEEATAEVVRRVPSERLLVETDSPYLSPPGAPRGRNEPEWVRITADWVAAGREEERARFGEQLLEAYDVAFHRARGAVG
jgi:TatD DNase family protein